MEQIETMYNPLPSLIAFEHKWNVDIEILYHPTIANKAKVVNCRWRGLKIMQATKESVCWCLPLSKVKDIFTAFEEFVKPIFDSKITPLKW